MVDKVVKPFLHHIVMRREIFTPFKGLYYQGGTEVRSGVLPNLKNEQSSKLTLLKVVVIMNIFMRESFYDNTGK